MSPTPGTVRGVPRLLLRLEGLAVVMVAVALQARGDHSWWLFTAVILVPDLALLGYLAGPRLGAAAYNAAHTYLGPALLIAASGGQGPPLAIALAWAAHIGVDRALGFGLKYAAGFGATHLGALGAPGTTPPGD